MNTALDPCPDGAEMEAAAAPFDAALAISGTMGAALAERNWERFMRLVDRRDDALRRVIVQPPRLFSEADREALRALDSQNRAYLREARSARAILAKEIKRIRTGRVAARRYRETA